MVYPSWALATSVRNAELLRVNQSSPTLTFLLLQARLIVLMKNLISFFLVISNQMYASTVVIRTTHSHACYKEFPDPKGRDQARPA